MKLNKIIYIILASLCAICGGLMLLPVFLMETFNFIGAAQTIGLITFFWGVAAVFILLAVGTNPKINSFTLLVVGCITLSFLLIGSTGMSKTNPQGAIGKSYAYFASVENKVEEGSTLIEEKQRELNLKKYELDSQMAKITGLGLIAADWSNIATGFTSAGLFGTMINDEFNVGVLASTKIIDIVANPEMTDNSPAIATINKLLTIQSQLISAGLGSETLQYAPYIIGGTLGAMTQALPQLTEAITQLQGVIDSNRSELETAKSQIKDANAAALCILFLYITLILTTGVTPLIIAIKKLFLTKQDI